MQNTSAAERDAKARADGSGGPAHPESGDGGTPLTLQAVE